MTSSSALGTCLGASSRQCGCNTRWEAEISPVGHIGYRFWKISSAAWGFTCSRGTLSQPFGSWKPWICSWRTTPGQVRASQVLQPRGAASTASLACVLPTRMRQTLFEAPACFQYSIMQDGFAELFKGPLSALYCRPGNSDSHRCKPHMLAALHLLVHRCG